jgi:4'-phosphopantetheinyl transferase EntD
MDAGKYVKPGVHQFDWAPDPLRDPAWPSEAVGALIAVEDYAGALDSRTR